MSYVGYIIMWSLFKIGLSEIGLQTPVLCFLANPAIWIYFQIGYRTGAFNRTALYNYRYILYNCNIIDLAPKMRIGYFLHSELVTW